MKQVKCFFKIQIPVCSITMQARGFAVWTTPSPRGDWNPAVQRGHYPAQVEVSEPHPHRKVLEPKNPDIRKDTGIFSIKNLKNAEKLVYIVKGKNVSRNLNYSEKRVDTCLILW